MTEPLTLARFQVLADAYGGVVARWPEEYRESAAAMAQHADARDILGHALVLDEALDAWRVEPPTLSLQERVTAIAPVKVERIVMSAKLWWSGLGIAAALAGAAAGTAAIAITAPVDAVSDNGTSFGDVAGSEI